MTGNHGKDRGFNLAGENLGKAPFKQRFLQWWYGLVEPYYLRFSDYMLRKKKMKKRYVKIKMPGSGVIISTEAACRFIDFIYSMNPDNGTARMAVTDCVCQTSLKKYKEPRKKDMALLYTAEMYTTLKHTGIKEKFDRIDTAEEAKKMVRYFDECGLLHYVCYCLNSGKYTFVMCNCDNEICVPFRLYMAGNKGMMGAGPEIVSYDDSKCLGIEKCGLCIERCVLNASFIREDGKSGINYDACLGCGLCVTTCKAKARTLIPREDYLHEDIISTNILLGKN